MAADLAGESSTKGAQPVPWPRLLVFPFAVRMVVRRWRGMVGMVIGVGVSIGLVMTMMGLLGAEMGQLVGDFPQSGANLYVAVESGHLIPLSLGDTPGTIDDGGAVLSKVRSIPGVQAAVGELSVSLRQDRPGPQTRRQQPQIMPAVALDGDPSELANFIVMREGRWLRRSNEVVLGPALSQSKALRAGDTVKLDGQEFDVVGIGKLRGFGQAPDSVAYVDVRNLRQRGLTGNALNFIAVQTSAPQAVRNVADDLSLRAVSPDELTRDMFASSAYKSAVGIYWIIDLFILGVAGLFISNMLGRSVAERRLEFGTLRAIGLPSRTILLSVAAEGIFIVLVSFVFGFFESLALGEAMNVWVAPTVHFDHLFAVDPTTYLVLFVLTLGLGLIAAFFPARGATKVDPLDVLREA